MEIRHFGNTDLACSSIGFGTWEMGGTQYGQIDLRAAKNAVRAAIHQGVTLFDTAEIYGPFSSEELLAQALGSDRRDVVIVTKVGFAYDDNAPPRVVGRDASADHILARTDGCLQRLETDYIDLLLVHWPDHKTPHEETIGALTELQRSGKIRHFGVSNYDVPMMQECEKTGHLAANQVGYHMFDRRMEAEVLQYCGAAGIGFMSYGSLGFGLLTGALTPQTEFVDWDWRRGGNAFGLPLFERDEFLAELRVVDKLQAFAKDHGKSVAQLAIAWVLRNVEVTVALVGMRNDVELRENVAAADWRLSEDDLEQIDRIFDEESVPTHKNAPQAR